MYRVLVDRVAAWARQWVPSLVVASTGSDFQQWTDWCVEYVSDVLRYYGLRDLLRCPVGAADQAVRWEVATEICLRGWYDSAPPREALRTSLSEQWIARDNSRISQVRRRGAQHLRQLGWLANVTRMPPEERDLFEQARVARPRAELPALLPHLHSQRLLHH
eukprot:4627441-Pyramimonas_sp.AAC.1